MVKFKLSGDRSRVDGTEPLCCSCKYGSIIKGRTFNEDIIRCGAFEQFVKIWVTECPSWHDAKLPTIYEFRQSAWYKVGKNWYNPEGVKELRMKGQVQD